MLQIWTGVLTGKVRVVKLDVSKAMVIKNLQFILVCFRNIGKVLIVICIHIGRVCLALLVSKMIPIRGSECKLYVSNLVSRNQALHVVKLISIGAALMLDLSRADDGLPWLVTCLCKCSNVGDIHSEDLWVWFGDLSHALEAWPEGAPEHVPSILAVCDAMEAKVLLDLDDVLHILVFNRRQI